MPRQKLFKKIRPYLKECVRFFLRMKIRHHSLALFWSVRRSVDHRLFFLRSHFERPLPVKPEGKPWRILYASPVGKFGKPYLAKIIHRFGHENFDYLIFVYDETSFPEPVFKNCRFVYEKGILCHFFKKYLTPEHCQNYDYIFPWVDDIDIDHFSYSQFLEIFERNQLELAQPALSRFSLYSHPITRKSSAVVGRFTDFAEVMVQVFTREAWIKYWKLIEPDKNFWGWGYDFLAKSYCDYDRVGIIDCQTVTHMCRSTNKGDVRLENHRQMQALFDKHALCQVAEQKVCGELR